MSYTHNHARIGTTLMLKITGTHAQSLSLVIIHVCTHSMSSLSLARCACSTPSKRTRTFSWYSTMWRAAASTSTYKGTECAVWLATCLSKGGNARMPPYSSSPPHHDPLPSPPPSSSSPPPTAIVITTISISRHIHHHHQHQHQQTHSPPPSLENRGSRSIGFSCTRRSCSWRSSPCTLATYCIGERSAKWWWHVVVVLAW